jgi:hypothetical protein
MSTDANVFRSLRSSRRLRHALRGARRRGPHRGLRHLRDRQRRMVHEAAEQARRAWAPDRGSSFSFGDTPSDRRARRAEQAERGARARFYLACAVGIVVGFGIFHALIA